MSAPEPHRYLEQRPIPGVRLLRPQKTSIPPLWLFRLGSIPQQDVFQRVMSAKSAETARNGAAIGGLSYILFAFVPMQFFARQIPRRQPDSRRSSTSKTCARVTACA